MERWPAFDGDECCLYLERDYVQAAIQPHHLWLISGGGKRFRSDEPGCCDGAGRYSRSVRALSRILWHGANSAETHAAKRGATTEFSFRLQRYDSARENRWSRPISPKGVSAREIH